jgi:hypothetical protein
VFNKLARAEPTSLEEEEEEEEEDLDSSNSVDLESTQLMILQLRSLSVSELWIFQGPKIHQIMKNSCKSRIRSRIRKLELKSASSS